MQTAQPPKGFAIADAAKFDLFAGTPHDRSPRIGLALLVLALIAIGLGCGGYLASAPTTRLAFADASWTAAALVAVLGSLSAARRATAARRAGRLLLLGGSSAWLLGQMFWDSYGNGSLPASPNLADLCWLTCALALAAGVHRLCRGPRMTSSVSLLESTPLIVAVGAVVMASLSHDLSASHLSGIAQATIVAYPVLYVSGALVTLQAVIAGAIDLRRNKGVMTVIAGVAFNAAGFILWAPQLLAGTYAVGASPLDGFWTVGVILIGAGAWASAPTITVRPVARADSALLPSLVFIALAGVQVAVSTGEGNNALALSVGLLVVGASLIAHGWLLRRRQAELLGELHSREHELRAVNSRLSDESRRDVLTGLGNRLSLREHLSEAPERYCVVLIDIDRFKDYNDAEGHQAGDHVLALIGGVLADNTRADEQAYRYGGEELLVIQPEQGLEQGVELAERLLKNVRGLILLHPSNPPHGIVTFSAGVAAARPGESPTEVFRRADEALYRAKDEGRSAIAVAEPGGQRRGHPATHNVDLEYPPARAPRGAMSEHAKRR